MMGNPRFCGFGILASFDPRLAELIEFTERAGRLADLPGYSSITEKQRQRVEQMRVLHAIPPSSAIPTLADNCFIREQQEKPSERQARRCERERGTEAGPGAAAAKSAAAAESSARHDDDDNDPAEVGITHPRLGAACPLAQSGGPAVARHSPGGAVVAEIKSEREARAALARSVLPYAAQVMWGVAL